MFGLGMGELMVILVVALLFIGPKKLPKLAADLGKAVRSFKKATNDIQDQVSAELREANLRDQGPARLAPRDPAVLPGDPDYQPPPAGDPGGAAGGSPPPAA